MRKLDYITLNPDTIRICPLESRKSRVCVEDFAKRIIKKIISASKLLKNI